MKYARRRFSLSLMLVLALLVLLPVLAVLQYKLLGQVSASERERMQANLKSSAARFSHDFDREIARVFLCLQTGPSLNGTSIWDGYPARYDRWLSSSPHPQLVSDVFRVEGQSVSDLSLSKYNLAARRFDACDWPEEFESLKRNFEESAEREKELRSKYPQAFRSLVISGPGGARPNLNAHSSLGLLFRGTSGPLQGNVPALVIPAFSLNFSSTDAKVEQNANFGILIIKLNQDYIRERLIPELAHRYFTAGDALEYKIALINQSNSDKVIYQSDDDFPASDSASDLTEKVFTLRMEDIESIASENALQLRESLSSTDVVKDSISVQVIERSPTPIFRSLKMPGGEGQWDLLLKHRAGSLEAVVASARHRNLTISFGILLLLGASIVLIIISTRRAERLARQQIEFVAGVTHELRTPLAVIRSAGENLADGVIRESEQVRRYGSLIAGEGRRLTEMVEQVLEFSGIQSGRRTYHLQPVSVSDVIADAIAACKPLIAEGGFDIEREIEDDLPPVAADLSALSRALQNLLSNAIKYSGESRLVKIKARSNSVGRASEVEITIEDHGLGIESEDLPHIFEPFHRGQAILAAQIHGNGLGLSLVKHIIDSHNGRITVESAPGRGSSFTVHLPSVSQADEALKALKDESAESGILSQESVAGNLQSSASPRPSYE